MAASTGIVLAMGAIVLANQTLAQKKPFNFKIALATGILALAMGGLDAVSPDLATGLALIAFTTAMIAPIGGQSPAESLLRFAGFGG